MQACHCIQIRAVRLFLGFSFHNVKLKKSTAALKTLHFSVSWKTDISHVMSVWSECLVFAAAKAVIGPFWSSLVSFQWPAVYSTCPTHWAEIYSAVNWKRTHTLIVRLEVKRSGYFLWILLCVSGPNTLV